MRSEPGFYARLALMHFYEAKLKELDKIYDIKKFRRYTYEELLNRTLQNLSLLYFQIGCSGVIVSSVTKESKMNFE